jgi:hypothetical protein
LVQTYYIRNSGDLFNIFQTKGLLTHGWITNSWLCHQHLGQDFYYIGTSGDLFNIFQRIIINSWLCSQWWLLVIYLIFSKGLLLTHGCAANIVRQVRVGFLLTCHSNLK